MARQSKKSNREGLFFNQLTSKLEGLGGSDIRSLTTAIKEDHRSLEEFIEVLKDEKQAWPKSAVPIKHFRPY